MLEKETFGRSSANPNFASYSYRPSAWLILEGGNRIITILDAFLGN